MRVALACAAVLACALGGMAEPLTASPAVASPASPASPNPSPSTSQVAASAPLTRIAVNGNSGDRVFDGVGAVLGGGGNARYLMDYPARQRDQILSYLFKPGYGAALQILKLEIGGDADSSDGAEPSIEHRRGHVKCAAGYEFAIARRAVALNPRILLYGLQWAAPGWVRGGGPRFTNNDIRYLLDWLGCARRQGLRISYLGGWNESDTGIHQRWFRHLRRALNSRGYRGIQIVAADSTGPDGWHYVGDKTISILGAHGVCGKQTGIAGPRTACNSPWSLAANRATVSQTMWASELGGMDGGAQRGCRQPCAPAMDRAIVRGYVDARLTGFLEWPVLDAMPPGLPYGNRGLVTADWPWAGSYRVNAMTWAIAQLTQFAHPPSGRVQWRFVNSGSGRLGSRVGQGAYITLVRTPVRGAGKHKTIGRATAWSTIIEATTATSARRASFHVTGGNHLAGRTVHVWASNFTGNAGPRQWFVRQRSIRPGPGGRFSLTIRPGWVYSLTTTTGQGHGRGRGRGVATLRMPLRESLGSAGPAKGADNEAPYLAAQQGAFELAPCQVADRGARTCTVQRAVGTPVFWHSGQAIPRMHYPYAVIGAQDWTNYTVSVDVLLPSRTASAGLIGRFGCRMATPNSGAFDGYVFSVSADGAWSVVKNSNPKTTFDSASCEPGPAGPQTLAAGTLGRTLRPGTWHRLSFSFSGAAITAAVDGTSVASVSDSTWSSGPAGIAAGAFTGSWPHVQYSHLSVTSRSTQ